MRIYTLLGVDTLLILLRNETFGFWSNYLSSWSVATDCNGCSGMLFYLHDDCQCAESSLNRFVLVLTLLI